MKTNESGFSLIELVIAMLIIGILSAISLPAFLSSVNKAKETEATQSLGSIADSQKIYFNEKNKFPATMAELGFNTNTLKYYNIDSTASDPEEGVETNATPKTGTNLKSYRMCVYLSHSQTTGETQILSDREDAPNASTQPANCPPLPVSIP